MSITKGMFAVAMRAFLFCCVVTAPAFAQNYTLSGKVSDSAGHAVASATVSAKSVATGQTFSAKTGKDGMYSIHDLAGGDYMVSAVAGELQAPPIKVTLAAAQTTDLTVSPATKGAEALPNAPQQEQGAPANPNAPSLSDLGFTPQQTQANTELQATLAKRTKMLKIHQKLGLITTLPIAFRLGQRTGKQRGSHCWNHPRTLLRFQNRPPVLSQPFRSRMKFPSVSI
ncbi:MAG: carboxypeptidase-like regulatory domain-containing protein [Terracidiphilus sp.]